ncbi:MAGE-domain-containing protein [Polychaeton citri CBS 116435]|uniref:MAGE-domain-containing protein n=1 Tax=Polychaeton citri CBS 116435 TaxID=1314669 RepID=A0A9P4Q0I3_9PEZI|nr:MAGE-domain-containing protein [Polychaeton citri CBS 116435]
MPLLQNRKRRQQPEEDDTQASVELTPEPPTQRRRAQHDAGADEAYGDEYSTAGDVSLDQMVKKLVRLALACEHQRRPIRRADISEKVLGSSGSRHFKDVFSIAQVQLQSVFGMKMTELPAREKITLQQKRAAAKAATQGQNSKSINTSWVLTSTLPSEFHDPEIRLPPAAPTSEEDGKYTAIYSVLIALISLSGGQLPDAKLERYLQRLNMQDNTPVSGSEKTEKLFKRLEREQYIVKIKESGGGQEQDIYWVVGSRGKVEVGNDGVRGLVKAVYGVEEDDEVEELEKKLRRSLGIPDASREVNDAGGAASQPATKQKRRGRPRRNDGDGLEAEDEAADDDDDNDENENEDD